MAIGEKLRSWKAREQIAVRGSFRLRFLSSTGRAERYGAKNALEFRHRSIGRLSVSHDFQAGSPQRDGINFYKGIKRPRRVRRGEERGASNGEIFPFVTNGISLVRSRTNFPRSFVLFSVFLFRRSPFYPNFTAEFLQVRVQVSIGRLIYLKIESDWKIARSSTYNREFVLKCLQVWIFSEYFGFCLDV